MKGIQVGASLLLATAIAVASSSCRSSPPETPHGEAPSALQPLDGAAEGYNIWLITIDTLRADRLGAWGYRQRNNSPRIDALVAQGVAFERAGAPRASTWPSLASVLTGLYPSRHGLIANGYSFSEDQPTLPSLLAAQGYETAAFLSNMCQAGHRGWDTLSCAGGRDGRLNKEVRAWLEQRSADRPVLLWTHYFGAHGPYYNGGDLAITKLDPEYEGPISTSKEKLNRIMIDGVALSEADQRHLDAIYDAAVMGVDGLVGRLYDSVAEHLDLERTIIILLADHGEDLYDHNGYLYHACSVYQSSLHVPLAIVAPGLIAAGSRESDPVSLVDVLSTLLGLTAVPVPADLDGSSLVPILEDSTSPLGRGVFSEYGDTRIGTIWRDRWKLVHNPDGVEPICMPGAPADLYPIAPLELYDLVEDPTESHNLAAESPQQARLLLAELLEWRSSFSGSVEKQELDERLRKELEALGYVVD